MLRKLPWRVDQGARELEREHEAPVVHIEAQFLSVAFLDAVAAIAPDRPGEPRGHVFAEAKRLADLAHRAARAQSEERRVGKEWVSTCRYRWSPDHSKTKYTKNKQNILTSK